MRHFALTGNSNFRRLYSRGKSAAGAYVVVYSMPNRLNRVLVGYTVSAKVGNAVARNRARRRISEAFRLNFANKLKPGVTVVFVSRSGAVRCAFPKLVGDMRFQLNKLGLLLP